MARVKFKKLPKKPKANASAAVMERWLHKVQEVKNHNAQKVRDANHKKSLRERISRIGSADVMPGVGSRRTSHKRRKTVTHKRKTTRKHRR